ncbi:MAG: tRNA (adenosine(37)-N6)-threonylcarbamoyltransferase complex ATPase subunit type 1 TsaE [Prevotella sp.]|nr:tRNA (adenosine(37)-N6)-threonylcarbamoyltransferase complex ATPase subunit type 1 TsaE [Prevotella sp.]
MEIRIDNIEKIHEAARTFIREALPQHNVIAFYGKMGAGKTTFIKALCEELGVEEVITSPTFAIVNEYSITAPPSAKNTASEDLKIGAIYHFDFYRIKRLEEVYDMGYEDYFYQPDALCLIEWPELIEELLPETALCVNISELPDGSRQLAW